MDKEIDMVQLRDKPVKVTVPTSSEIPVGNNSAVINMGEERKT